MILTELMCETGTNSLCILMWRSCNMSSVSCRLRPRWRREMYEEDETTVSPSSALPSSPLSRRRYFRRSDHRASTRLLSHIFHTSVTRDMWVFWGRDNEHMPQRLQFKPLLDECRFLRAAIFGVGGFRDELRGRDHTSSVVASFYDRCLLNSVLQAAAAALLLICIADLSSDGVAWFRFCPAWESRSFSRPDDEGSQCASD